MISFVRAAVLVELICPSGSARLGTEVSTLDRMSNALVQAAEVLWPGEVEAADLAQCIAGMPEAAQRLTDLHKDASTTSAPYVMMRVDTSHTYLLFKTLLRLIWTLICMI